MSESGDFDPGPWTNRGHSFKSAHADYSAHAGRSYDDAVAAGKTLSDMLEKSLKTDSSAPMLIGTDETGSMGGWPATMFSKLPYLELEGQEYLGKDMEISWCAFNDAYTGVAYPVQARPFTKGTDLEVRLKEIALQGGGGSQMHESSELMLLYWARKVSMPKAINPIFFLITDEMPYDFVDTEQAKNIFGITLQKRISVEAVVKEVQQKGSLYVILKPYNLTAGDTDGDNAQIRKVWSGLVGADHVCYLPDPNRVVDVIFGVLAKETNRIDYFRKEIEGRQTKAQVNTVYKSLNTVHDVSGTKSKPKLPPGRSTMHPPGKSKKHDD